MNISKSMSKTKSTLLLSILIFFCIQSALTAQTLAIWQPEATVKYPDEHEAFIRYISSEYDTKILISDDLSKRSSLVGVDILWMNATDTLSFPPSLPGNSQSPLSSRATKNIKNYVAAGGKLLLTNQAVPFITDLGIEPVPPQTLAKPCRDEGYGRMLGFHSFREHPLFDGLHGGVYCLKPEEDTVVFQTGWFGLSLPGKGRVIAVDWDYIFLRENKKMIVEWELGKGKVLSVGGYMLFGLPNRNRLQLSEFTVNIVDYLTGASQAKEYYWHYGPYTTQASGITSPVKVATSRPWSIELSGPGLIVDMSEGSYLEASGERMLAMGDYLGGIREAWSHPFLSLRDLFAAIRFEDMEAPLPLNNLKPYVEVFPWGYVRTYSIREAQLREMVTVSPDRPLLVVHYEYRGTEPMELLFTCKSNLRMMWPYSQDATGTINHSLDTLSGAFVATDRTGDLVSLLAFSKRPMEARTGSFKKPGFTTDAFSSYPADTLLAAGFARIMLEPVDEIDLLHVAGTEGISNILPGHPGLTVDPYEVFLEAVHRYDTVMDEKLIITSSSVEFNTGYAWSLLATERFFVTTPDLGSSLVAGYATSDRGWDGGHAVSGRPGYGWYFGRDGEWSGMALLGYGDFEKVKLMLQMFINFQDLDGKIFHELSNSGFVHYDAADATPLFLVLAGRYLRHSGDLEFIRQEWPAILKAADFCYSTDTEGDLLIENTNVGHGWVEGGSLFGSHTSLYLASCWAEALKELSYMAGALGENEKAIGYRIDADEVVEIIDRKFWNRERNYYYHGLYQDGSFHQEPTIMPAIPMLFGQCDVVKAAQVLPVFASNVFTSDWGCRIVGENSPLFNPNGYHTGSVWPLFTGWASLAEFRYGNYLQGYSHLMNNLLNYRHWGVGFLEEVLNGATYKPSGVCHHQCWSQTMVQQPAIEGMLGFRPDALKDRITLAPWFPADWDTVSVTNLRSGVHTVSMEIKRLPDRTVYHFEDQGEGVLDVHFKPVFPPGTMIESARIDGQPAREPIFEAGEGGWVTASFGFWLRGSAEVVIRHSGGVALLPVVPAPEPGDGSGGFRVLSTEYQKGEYTLLFQGPRASTEKFKVWSAGGKEPEVEGARLLHKKDNILTYEMEFMDLETDYASKQVRLRVEF